MPPDWKQLADLTPDDLQMALLAEADAVMGGQYGPEEDRLLAALPEPLRAIWLLNWLDYEVSQGSLHAYFYNRHRRPAPLARELLPPMGANPMAHGLGETAGRQQP